MVFAVFVGGWIHNAPAMRLTKQLDLGKRYLDEVDYEQAVAAFDLVIEINPRNTDTYIGLGDPAMALETLEIGYQEAEENKAIKESMIKFVYENGRDCD